MSMTVQHSILVVEDEEVMRSILRQLLRDSGYDVFTANSAENAMQIFSENEISITLTDIKMSGKDGLELLDQIKTIEPEAIVIIMTAYSSVAGFDCTSIRESAFGCGPCVNPAG